LATTDEARKSDGRTREDREFIGGIRRLSGDFSLPDYLVRDMRAIDQLRELPPSERREGLEDLVATEFRTTLMMTDDEDLPFDVSFFELGCTSLRITEIKERLETRLDRRISTNVLFNSPTMERLVAYLAGEVLADLFATSTY
jgi:acyl carrier protein